MCETNQHKSLQQLWEFQGFLWLQNELNETALDVAIKEGHVEVAKLLLKNASFECLISERNHEGKLPVSMLTDTKYDMFILSILEKARTAALDLSQSAFIRIDEEDLIQDSEVYTDSIMDPKSYPLSHKHERGNFFVKLDQGTLELTPNQNTILHLVSHDGDIKYARAILEKHPSLVYRRNSEGETPAYIAAREGHVDILVLMICYFKSKNDDIESLLGRSIDNYTALHIATQNHHVGVVFWLIKEIPQLLDIINDFNESPIYLAAEIGYSSLLLKMCKCQRKSFKGPKGKTALHAAAISGSRASRGYCETMNVLMSHCPGCSELVDEKGMNILHVAVMYKKTEVIELLYRHGSYTSLVNKKDNEGNTPFHLLMASDLEMTGLVMNSKVNINALNNEKLTPLDMAFSNDKRKGMLEGIAMGKKKVELTDILSVSNTNKNELEELSQSRENVLIVATLIATASFAAGFTVPGGLDGNDGSEQGMPILLRKAAFKAFMVTDTLAFTFSCSVLFKHIKLSDVRPDLNTTRDEIQRMNTLTFYAMLAMIIAFATGIYVVMTPYLGFAIFLCVLALLSPFFLDFITGIIQTYSESFFAYVFKMDYDR